jgi:hypothetical protein
MSYPLQLIPVLVTRVAQQASYYSMHWIPAFGLINRGSWCTGMVGSGRSAGDAVTFRPTGERPLLLWRRVVRSWEVAVAHCLHLVSVRHAQQTLQHNAAPV